MKSNNISLTSLLLVIGGEFLIVASFFLIVRQIARGPVFYLDIGVVTAIYTIIISRFFNLWTDKENFDAKIGGLGLLMFFVYAYTLFAIAGIIFGVSALLPFKIQLMYQAILLFLFVAGSYLSQSSARFAVSVGENEQALKRDIRSLAETMTSIEMAYHAKNLNWDDEQQLIVKVKEKVRYLSASNNASAKQLESDFINEAQDVLYAIRSAAPDKQLINTKLKNCDNLLNQRKQFYIN